MQGLPQHNVLPLACATKFHIRKKTGEVTIKHKCIRKKKKAEEIKAIRSIIKTDGILTEAKHLIGKRGNKSILREMTAETGNTETSLKEGDEVGTDQKRTCSACGKQQCESVSTTVGRKCRAQMAELTISSAPLLHSISTTYSEHNFCQ